MLNETASSWRKREKSSILRSLDIGQQKPKSGMMCASFALVVKALINHFEGKKQ
jgi:hypothetical protein